MTEDVLAEAMVPFAFDLADDLKSKQVVGELDCDAYIFCHKGLCYGPWRIWPRPTSTAFTTSWRPARTW